MSLLFFVNYRLLALVVVISLVPHVIALNVLVLNFSFSWIMLHGFSVLFMSILGV